MWRKTTDERCKYSTIYLLFCNRTAKKHRKNFFISSRFYFFSHTLHILHFWSSAKRAIPPQMPLSIITKFLCVRLFLLRQHIFSIQCLNWFDCDIQTIVLDSHQSKFCMISLSSSIIIRVCVWVRAKMLMLIIYCNTLEIFIKSYLCVKLTQDPISHMNIHPHLSQVAISFQFI